MGPGLAPLGSLHLPLSCRGLQHGPALPPAVRGHPTPGPLHLLFLLHGNSPWTIPELPLSHLVPASCLAPLRAQSPLAVPPLSSAVLLALPETPPQAVRLNADGGLGEDPTCVPRSIPSIHTSIWDRCVHA